jgi:F-type H+-transporting ATPase subunit a
MLLGLGIGGIFAGLIPMVFNVALYMLEFLVAVLQAYVFAILASIYLKDTVDLHH